MAELLDQHDPPIAGEGDDVHPIGGLDVDELSRLVGVRLRAAANPAQGEAACFDQKLGFAPVPRPYRLPDAVGPGVLCVAHVACSNGLRSAPAYRLRLLERAPQSCRLAPATAAPVTVPCPLS